NAGVALRGDADARREAGFDRELRGVFAGDEQSALLDELAEVLKAVVAEARADVIGRIEATKVWCDVGFLPGHRVVPHGQAVEDIECGGTANGRKDDDVVFRAQIVLFRDGLRADVVKGNS